jgi:predicted Asp-tRNA(Asn)/Glu-tRNA(Gln) amidotransferase subunit C
MVSLRFMDSKEKEKIRKEARKLLDKFSRSLEKVEVKEEKIKKNRGGFREEGNGEESDADFKKRMFENAPEKDENFIIAEKKNW